MTQSKTEPKLYSFDEFISWYPENSEVRYELHDGVIIEMLGPKGKHSNLTGSVIEQLLIVIRQIGKGGIWTIPRESIFKPQRERSGYEPDIIVLNQEVMGAESRWSSESIIQNPDSVKLIVEVVSTNWRDDYYNKLRDYEKMGIEEYWIIEGLSGESNSPACKYLNKINYTLQSSFSLSPFTFYRSQSGN